jgi:glutaredoxin
MNNSFIIIGLNGCPYFENSKKLLLNHNLPIYSIYEIKKNTKQYSNLKKYTEKLKTYKQIKFNLQQKKPLRFTTPKIFLGNYYIGGYEDLYEYINDLPK